MPETVEREFFRRLAVPSAKLATAAAKARAEFSRAQPFPHIVIDGLFDDFVLERVLDEFPGPKDIDWIEFDTAHERKLATRRPSQIGLFGQMLIAYLNSSEFIGFVEDVTGMRGLIPDPHIDGGGLHQIPAGGKLGMHTDFLTQQRLKLDRRLNLIVYLNKDWQDAWNGHLELWEKDMSRCVEKIAPLFNRLALFTTTSHSLHGHPEPLACPPDRFRRSVALYYYSNGRPSEEVGGVRPTTFVRRPGERLSWNFRQIAKKFIPPIVNDLRYLIRK
jgi:hypothetical protein